MVTQNSFWVTISSHDIFGMKKLISVLAVLCLGMTLSWADEGMWMINGIDKALEKQMKKRGLKLSAKEIYNADAEGATISDAVVSLDFGCTGSVISDAGLVITNHHCAYSDVHALSTDEKNCCLYASHFTPVDNSSVSSPVGDRCSTSPSVKL